MQFKKYLIDFLHEMYKEENEMSKDDKNNDSTNNDYEINVNPIKVGILFELPKNIPKSNIVFDNQLPNCKSVTNRNTNTNISGNSKSDYGNNGNANSTLTSTTIQTEVQSHPKGKLTTNVSLSLGTSGNDTGNNRNSNSTKDSDSNGNKNNNVGIERQNSQSITIDAITNHPMNKAYLLYLKYVQRGQAPLEINVSSLTRDVISLYFKNYALQSSIRSLNDIKKDDIFHLLLLFDDAIVEVSDVLDGCLLDIINILMHKMH